MTMAPVLRASSRRVIPWASAAAANWCMSRVPALRTGAPISARISSAEVCPGGDLGQRPEGDQAGGDGHQPAQGERQQPTDRRGDDDPPGPRAGVGHRAHLIGGHRGDTCACPPHSAAP